MPVGRWDAAAVAAVVAVVVLAGCSAKAPSAAAGATQSTGVLHGLVVDGAVHPVAGANVTVRAGNSTLAATTGADGLFRFGGLEPGNYLVQVSKAHFLQAQQAVDVHAGVADPPLAKLVIEFQADSLPFADVYKYDGFYECGAYQVRICSNINIATWVVICAQTHVCLGNVTNDRSLLFQWIQPGVTFLQAELSWDSTLDSGRALSMLIGGGSDAELKQGVNLPAYNNSEGPSPLMVRVSNHESPDTWCARVPSPPCQTPDTLNSSKIGTERALLVQIDAGATYEAAPSCGVPPEVIAPCGAGFAAQQKFSLYTTAFYRYEPPVDWLFSTAGAPPPPPS
jgi:hypothetical protein